MRFNGLDLARAVFMMLGIFYHSALAFAVDKHWRIHYPDTHIAFNYFSSFIHDFRMFGFYILAGFFYVLVVERYGKEKTLITRLERLGIPMLFIGVTFNSAMNYLDQTHTLEFSAKYILGGVWLGQLWFIGNLIIYNLLALPIAHYFISAKKEISRATLYLVIFFITPLLSLLFIAIGGKIFNGTLLFVTFGWLYEYLPFYLLGMVLYKYKHLLVELISLKMVPVLFISYWALNYLFELELLPGIANNYIELIGTTALTFSFIGLFNQIAKQSVRLSRFVDASYSVYLLHSPFIVFFFPLIEYFNLPAVPSFFILSFSVLFSTYYLHTTIIRPNKFLHMLFNGIIKRS